MILDCIVQLVSVLKIIVNTNKNIFNSSVVVLNVATTDRAIHTNLKNKTIDGQKFKNVYFSWRNFQNRFHKLNSTTTPLKNLKTAFQFGFYDSWAKIVPDTLRIDWQTFKQENLVWKCFLFCLSFQHQNEEASVLHWGPQFGTFHSINVYNQLSQSDFCYTFKKKMFLYHD